MNSREKYTGNKEEFYFFLKDEVIKLFKDRLKIEGERVLIPDNEELDYQIKFDSDENYGDFTIKVKWGEKTEQFDGFEENTNDNEDKTFEF
ncbi:MAG: hypothetical protein ACREV6_00895 [Clostridium sp.]|uniref:hypothetical protein n=1 Tax=Clostridium sp. TaxID=1506 RepID=UPI003D6CE630